MKRILVTSALPYANGPMHIGQLAGCYLPADIYVKYQKLKKRDVIHICGTDEHGVLITLKALQEKTTPKNIVDKYYPDIKSSLENLGIEYTNFSRTTKPIHYQNVQNFFLKLYQKEYIVPKTSEQLYCNNCKQFLPERFVEGICPYCGFPSARGDQCEKCGRWLEPTMLREPKCQMCGATPVTQQTKHWFLRLDLLQPKLEKWFHSKTNWRENVTKFVNTWLHEGLEPRPVTRDIDWGVPVPIPDAKNKVIYVWFEALIGYISSTIEWHPNLWKDYWLNSDTELVHFIAKDNIVFHAIVWPAMLMAHDDFVLPTQIPANEFLNIEGKKTSTSRNWAVWLTDYLQNFEPDPLRYVLTMNAPEKGDVDFTWDDFLAKNNNELSNTLGNFVHRTLGFITKYMDGKIPHPQGYTSEDEEIFNKIELTRDEVGSAIENFEFKKALKQIMALVKLGNQYFDYNKPWLRDSRTPTVIYTCTALIANLSVLLHPFLPFTARSIQNMLNLIPLKSEPTSWGSKVLNLEGVSPLPLTWDLIGKLKLPEGAPLKKPKILFKKLEKSQIEKEKQKLTAPLTQIKLAQKGLSGNLLDGKGKGIPTKSEGLCRGRLPDKITHKDFEKLDLRIAEILEASKVEGTKKLLRLKISIGDETRKIVAGIAEDYSPQELIGKKIVVLTNLEPRTVHGVQSNAMLLAATHQDKITLLIPDYDIPPGSPIS